MFSSISRFILEMSDFPASTSETALSRAALQLSVYETETVPQLFPPPPEPQISPRLLPPDLVLQPAAVLLLLPRLLLQPESLPPGFTQAEFGFPVVLRQRVQQVFRLRDGEIPFSDGLPVLREFLLPTESTNATSQQRLRNACSLGLFPNQMYGMNIRHLVTAAQAWLSASCCFICVAMFSHHRVSWFVSRMVWCTSSVILSIAAWKENGVFTGAASL